MKKAFRFIWKTLLWIVYLLLTANERSEYMYAKEKGREVTKVDNGLFSTTVTYGRPLGGEEPKRKFITWKEYRQRHNF